MRARTIAGTVLAVTLLLPAIPAAAHVKSYDTEATLETSTGGRTPGVVTSEKAACEKNRKVTLTEEAGFLGDDTTNKDGEFRVIGFPDGDVTVKVAKRTIKQTSKHKHVCRAFSDGPIDVLAPLVAITSPGEDETTGPDGSIIYTTGDAVSVSCTLDGGPVSCDLSGTFNFSSLTDDQHTFVVTGTDDSGNESPIPVNWSVDATPPTVQSLDVVSAGGTGGSVQFTLSDTSFISQVRCVLDTVETTCGSGTSGSIGWDGPGQHRIEVYGIDQWGNSGEAAPPEAPPAVRAFAAWSGG